MADASGAVVTSRRGRAGRASGRGGGGADTATIDWTAPIVRAACLRAPIGSDVLVVEPAAQLEVDRAPSELGVVARALEDGAHLG